MSILDRSESRRGYTVRVLAVHTTEGGGTPQALRDAAWWTGSSHAIADEDTLLTPEQGMVPYSRAAWTLRSGNYWSENIELIGYASYTRDDWLARPGLLENCAQWLADRSKANGIPLSKISAAEYRAGGWGVIGHVDHTVGYQDGTHYDPGPNFPYDVVIQRARDIQNGDDMPLNDADAQKVADKVLRTRLKLKDGSTPQVGSILVGIIDRLKSQATTLGEHGIQLDDIEDYVDGDDAPPAA